MRIDRQVDTLGMQCPLPVVEARKALDALPAGAVVEVISSDPGSVADFPVFCSATGHELLVADESGGQFRFVLRKRR